MDILSNDVILMIEDWSAQHKVHVTMTYDFSLRYLFFYFNSEDFCLRLKRQIPLSTLSWSVDPDEMISNMLKEVENEFRVTSSVRN